MQVGDLVRDTDPDGDYPIGIIVGYTMSGNYYVEFSTGRFLIAEEWLEVI